MSLASFTNLGWWDQDLCFLKDILFYCISLDTDLEKWETRIWFFRLAPEQRYIEAGGKQSYQIFYTCVIERMLPPFYFAFLPVPASSCMSSEYSKRCHLIYHLENLSTYLLTGCFISFSNRRSKSCVKKEHVVSVGEAAPCRKEGELKMSRPSFVPALLGDYLIYTFWPVPVTAYFISNIKYDMDLPWTLPCKHTHTHPLVRSPFWLTTSSLFVKILLSELSKSQKLAIPRFTLSSTAGFCSLGQNVNISACFPICEMEVIICVSVGLKVNYSFVLKQFIKTSVTILYLIKQQNWKRVSKLNTA